MYKPKAYLKARTMYTSWYVEVPLQGTVENTVEEMNHQRNNPKNITYEPATWGEYTAYRDRLSKNNRRKKAKPGGQGLP
jgi:hypothetical protein